MNGWHTPFPLHTVETTCTPRIHFLVVEEEEESVALSLVLSLLPPCTPKLSGSKVAAVTARMCVAKRGRQKIKTVTRVLACARARARFALVSRPPVRFFTRARVGPRGKSTSGEPALARDKLISTLRRSSLAVSREFLTNVLALAEDGEFA